MQLLVDNEDEEEESDEVEETVKEEGEPGVDVLEMQLSVNAVTGSSSPKTMRMSGICQKERLHILVDSGNTHNFMSVALVKKLGLCLLPVEDVTVTVTNGQTSECVSYCEELGWKMQSQNFKAEAYVIPLENYDLILEA